MRKRLFFLFLIFSFGSCFDQNDCLINSTNIVKIELDNLSGTPFGVTFLRVLKADSSGHFVSYENTPEPISELELPLDPQHTQSSFNFLTSDSVEYHLTLGYTTYARVISTSCGAFTYYRNLTVVKTTFDSTRITTPELLTGDTNNLKIYF